MRRMAEQCVELLLRDRSALLKLRFSHIRCCKVLIHAAASHDHDEADDDHDGVEADDD